MIKKLSMVVLGVAVMGFCMAVVPQGKAEAALVWHTVSHYDGNEQGQTGCRDITKDFTTNSWGLALTFMGTFSRGDADVWTRMKCGKYKSYTVTIPKRWYNVKVNHFWLLWW